MESRTINHWCKVCGRGYHACEECERKEKKGEMVWRAVADTPEHFQIYLVLHEYDGGQLSKEEAKEMLLGLATLDEMVNFVQPCLGLVREIFGLDDLGQVENVEVDNTEAENAEVENVETDNTEAEEKETEN